MVVIDNARSRIGRNIDVIVTSVLQTTAGRMIFGRHAESASSAAADAQTPKGDVRQEREDSGRRPRPAAQA
ncbi:hypothetical protein D3C83_145600 [compost metagenome]